MTQRDPSSTTGCHDFSREPESRPYVNIPISRKLLGELRYGVPCAGVQIIGTEQDGFCVLILSDPDRPFQMPRDAAA